MTPPRVFIYVQSLLGIGHLARAATLARGFAAAGGEVDLVSGGMPARSLALGGARLLQLPPARSADENFSALVDENGNAIDDEWRAARREMLLGHFRARNPDILLFDMFPFGRRQLHFELLPLLDAARAAAPRPLIAASVRDIVQSRRKPGRAEETLALVARGFDLVLVHGDPALARFEESFPLADRLGAALRYTGYVAEPPPMRGGGGDPGWGEVIVSAGGGAVGRVLLETALAARPLTRLKEAPWRLLVGQQVEEAALTRLRGGAPSGVIVERARADFPRLLANCHMSVSQAGYNTVMDVLNAAARAVFVPFAGSGETEQALRAEKLARLGLARLVSEAELTPASLAAAIDAAEALDDPRRPSSAARRIDRNGAETTIKLLLDASFRQRNVQAAERA